MSTVNEFLADCGLCPECGGYVDSLWYENNHEKGFAIRGKCSNEFCDSIWKWEVRISEWCPKRSVSQSASKGGRDTEPRELVQNRRVWGK